MPIVKAEYVRWSDKAFRPQADRLIFSELRRLREEALKLSGDSKALAAQFSRFERDLIEALDRG